jgi:predicted nicotinamide N-methyase
MSKLDLVEAHVQLPARTLSILRPRDAEALLDEEAFEHEEFLPYWAELWSSGEVLAREVAGRDVAGSRIVELGCGLALPSLAAAAGGGVLATDWSPDASSSRGRTRVATRSSSRGAVRWSAQGVAQRAPWISCSPPTCSTNDATRRAVALLPQLGAEVLIADPGRPHAKTFLERAADDWEIEAQDRVFQLRLRIARAETNL